MKPRSISSLGKTLLMAAHVAPMDRPLIRDGGVVVENGFIVAVGTIAELSRTHPDAERIDLGGVVLLPGLVNPHTHLELSACKVDEFEGGSFTDWILSIRPRLKLTPENRDTVIRASTLAGVEQCLRFGVTSVGDITSHIAITRNVLADSPLAGVSFGEALGLAKAKPRFEASLAEAIKPFEKSTRLRAGISPHAPYTVDMDGYKECLAISKRRNLPLATHLSESPDETQFLVRQSGPFRGVWDSLDAWQEDVITFPATPIRFAEAIGLLEFPSLLAHVNYCDDEELDLLSAGRASVVYCPRTHAYFGHPPHRWREMIERGVNVAVGTDSCASSPNLNLVDDLRLLHLLAPEVSCETLWQMITTRAAIAIGQADQLGSISPGKWADLVAFETTTEDPLREILSDDDQLPQHLWIAGQRVSPSPTLTASPD